MNEAQDIRIEQVRQIIFEKANRLSRQVTEAAEEMGRHAAEMRSRAANEETNEPRRERALKLHSEIYSS